MKIYATIASAALVLGLAAPAATQQLDGARLTTTTHKFRTRTTRWGLLTEGLVVALQQQNAAYVDAGENAGWNAFRLIERPGARSHPSDMRTEHRAPYPGRKMTVASRPPEMTPLATVGTSRG